MFPAAKRLKTSHGVLQNTENEKYNFKALNRRNPACRDASVYQQIAKIGQGTYGEVFKAKEKNSKKNEFVAMKKLIIANEREGFPIAALREIKILQTLKHENIVTLIEVCRSNASPDSKFKSQFSLIFEFCDYDLAKLLFNPKVTFNLGEIKKMMQQLLNGLFYLHSNKVFHRDLKSANILITKAGVLKLADFGLAKAFSGSTIPKQHTPGVVTLWYRPPEVLLGDRNHTPAIDIWAAGCIMAEMWTRWPIMQGYTEQQMLKVISDVCGTICPEVWPGVEKLDLYQKFKLPKGQKRQIKDKLRQYVQDTNAHDLLEKLLTLDPTKRIDANAALDHDFFWTDPMPCDIGPMLARHKSIIHCLPPARKEEKVLPKHHKPVPIRPPRLAATLGDQYFDRVF